MSVGLIGRLLGFLQLLGKIRDPRLEFTLRLAAQLLRPRAFGLTLLELFRDSLPVYSLFLSVLRGTLELLAPVFQLLKSVILIVDFRLLLADSFA